MATLATALTTSKALAAPLERSGIQVPTMRNTFEQSNVFQIMHGDRARWKVEHETFKPLKNQGYRFEHNFGHGTKNLSVVFALLMMLAFLVDQTPQLASDLFQSVLKKEGCRIRL